jgi:hypothetical protein
MMLCLVYTVVPTIFMQNLRSSCAFFVNILCQNVKAFLQNITEGQFLYFISSTSYSLDKEVVKALLGACAVCQNISTLRLALCFFA